MASVQTGISINAPREQVFELFTDLRSLGDRVSAIIKSEVLTDGPIGNGTRFRETRKMFGKESTEEMWISEFNPGVSYCVEAESCGSHYLSTYLFSDENGGTHVDMSFDATPKTFMAKVISPLMGLMLKSCAKMFDKDLAELKAAAEGGAPSAETSPA